MIAHSDALDQLAAALAKAQAVVKGATKDTTNPFFKSKYADLSSVWDACRDPLTANGLSIVQVPGFDAATQTVTVATMLLHSSGQWVRGDAAAPFASEKGRSDAQSVGSIVTYLRRYAVAAFASVCPEDDDGNGAGRRESRPSARAMATHQQRSLIASRAREKGIGGDTLKRMAEAVCGDVSQGIPADKVDAMLKEISEMPAEAPSLYPAPEAVEQAVVSEPAPSPFGNMAELVPEEMGADDLQTARARVLALLEDEEIPQDVRDTYRALLKKHTEKGSPAGEFHSLAQLLEGSKKVARKKAKEKQERLAETLTS